MDTRLISIESQPKKIVVVVVIGVVVVVHVVFVIIPVVLLMHNCMSILSNREKHNVINSKGSYCPKGSIISPASHRVLLTPQIYYGGFLIMFPDAKWHIFSGEITSALFIFDLIPLSMKF